MIRTKTQQSQKGEGEEDEEGRQQMKKLISDNPKNKLQGATSAFYPQRKNRNWKTITSFKHILYLADIVYDLDKLLLL